MKTGLNATGKKHRFGKAWMRDHVNDPYVQAAQKRGFRARAAFKLLEIDERDRLLSPDMIVVDLGSAPGSWCQAVREKLGERVTLIAVDLLPMVAIHGVDFIQGDFSSDEILKLIESRLSGKKADLVLSDMSPNLSGIASADQARSVHLAELALDFAANRLRVGGAMVVKVFQGAGFDEFRNEMAQFFDKVYVRKPKASRDKSREVYLVGKSFKTDAPAIR